MNRRLLNLLTALSLLLCAIGAALWLRGSFVLEELTWRREAGSGERRGSEEWRLFSGQGVLSLTHEVNWYFPAARPVAPGTPVTDVGPPLVGPPAAAPGPYHYRRQVLAPRARRVLRFGWWERLGFKLQDFAFESASVGHGGRTRQLRVPYWALVLATALPPLLWATRRWRMQAGRRRTSGRCAHCGYDLRATSGRCPECGTTAAAAT